MRTKLKQNYENACNAYLLAFTAKHGYDFEPDCWVGNDVGGIAMVGDLFVNLTDIRDDIDRDAPEQEFLKWYDYCLELHDLSTKNYPIPTPNYKSWLMGCPRKSVEEIQELEAMCQRVRDAKQALEDAIKRDGF
jgi:hypothetical protein